MGQTCEQLCWRRPDWLIDSNLENALLAGCWAKDADFRNAKMSGAKMDTADFTGADIRGASLQGARFSGARLEGTDMRCEQLEAAKLRGAIADRQTRWPEGFDPAGRGIVALTTPPMPSTNTKNK